nr:hypothetical protein KitaXyl93_08390 [Kitasatospora sp. Xyl93]
MDDEAVHPFTPEPSPSAPGNGPVRRGGWQGGPPARPAPVRRRATGARATTGEHGPGGLRGPVPDEGPVRNVTAGGETGRRPGGRGARRVVVRAEVRRPGMDCYGRVPLPGPIGAPHPFGVPLPRRVPGRDETRRLVFAGRAGAVQAGRDFSREALRSWRWLPAADGERPAVVEDVVLMVSELVTNACLHTRGGPDELRLRWDGRRLRVEVADSSPVRPELRPYADPGRPGRHGLRVVERLARSWGSAPEGGGKQVWLEVALPSGWPDPLGRPA